MNSTNSHIPRRSAFVLIALFSCLQILIGLSLIAGEGAADSSHVTEQNQRIEISKLINWENQ